MTVAETFPDPTVCAIIPVLNEEVAIAAVVSEVLGYVGHVIVVDGGSTDDTAARAQAAGAQVIVEPLRGYGRAMATGLAALPTGTTCVLFIDGDGSDRTSCIPDVLRPIRVDGADFVHGSRLKGAREPGSLSLPQRVAGHLAGGLILLLYRVRFTDMSPFRAITTRALARLGMTDTTFGWNLEMQMRAAAKGLRIVEVPVGQRVRRGGVSKVSGDLKTAVRVTWILAATFVRLARTLSSEAPLVRRARM